LDVVSLVSASSRPGFLPSWIWLLSSQIGASTQLWVFFFGSCWFLHAVLSYLSRSPFFYRMGETCFLPLDDADAHAIPCFSLLSRVLLFSLSFPACAHDVFVFCDSSRQLSRHHSQTVPITFDDVLLGYRAEHSSSPQGYGSSLPRR